MTAPARPLSGLVDKLLQIKQLQLQQQAQRLRERSEGAATIDLFRRLAAVSPEESRPALVQLFSQQTGMSPELLTSAALGPETPELIKGRKLAAGAGSVPNAAVASVGLTGQLPGAVESDQNFAQMLEGATPEQRQTYFNKAFAGVAVPHAMLPQATAVGAGLEASAGQKLQADLGISGIKSQETISASQQATQLAIANLEAYARLASGQGGANTMADLVKLSQNALEALSKGGLDETTQYLYITLLRETMGALGHDSNKLLPPGTKIDPSVLQKLSKKIPGFNFGRKGFEGIQPQGDQ